MQSRDLWRLGTLMLLGLAVGLTVGAASWGLLAGALVYISIVHRDLAHLLKWLRNRKTYSAPERSGIVEDLSLEIDYLRERHKKRKKKLSAYLRQFRKATRALPDATVVLDNQDEVRWANDAARAVLGVKWPTDAGQRVTNLFREPRLRKFMQERATSRSDTIEIESPIDSERQLSVVTAPYGSNQRLLVARDVTQMYRANQTRRDFVANVSHELRTPLTVIRGYLENLIDRGDECPPGWELALEQMSSHATRMSNLVEELLLLSRLESETAVREPERVDVAGMLTEIHAQARALSGDKEHLFSLEAASDIHLNGARAELFSAFSNLVFNAVHFSPPRSVISIRWYRDKDGAHFAVEDKGIGIGEEHIARLCERFYRVDPSRLRANGVGGTGLGLAIVKHVLAHHQASLSITSTIGSGSRFSADFPPAQIYASEAAGSQSRRDAG